MTKEETKKCLLSMGLYEELPNGKVRFKEELVNPFSYSTDIKHYSKGS